ncbi:MAG TPA: hypothetical protein VF692_12355 [Pyrinomonadaceae bacterium]
MKRAITAFSVAALFLIFSHATFAAAPDFSGFWTLDRTNSKVVPPKMSQTMTVCQTGDKITFETDLVSGGRVMQTVFAAYTLDGRETEFDLRTPNGIVIGKRAARRTVDGIELEEAAIFDTPGGKVTVRATHRWMLSADGKTLEIETTVQNSSGTEQTRRVFKKGEKPGIRVYFISN